jgi:hypothetical protein
MPFTEMMQSARGPGVIGMLMALFVLIGFGFLFIFAFDEGLQGADHSIEALIKSQRKEIDNIKDSITSGEKRLSATSGLRQIEKSLREIKSTNRSHETQLGILSNKRSACNVSLDEKNDEFEKYKNDYRGFVRTKAKGQTMERLETRNGKVFENVTIRDVNPVGMQIMHEGGFNRILFEDLPASLQDYYQFDAKQKDEALAKENSQLRDHESAVAIVKESQSQQNAERKEREAQVRRDETIRGISVRQSRIQLLEKEIQSLETALPLESQKRISRAPEMRMQLSNKRLQMQTLTMEIARMQSSLQQ